MRVKDIWSRDVKSCTPETNLADAAWAMWEGDCGVLPVLDAAGKAVGVITDRDIAIAVGTKYRPARDIAVHEVITGKLFSCAPSDDVRDALKTMRAEKVRRLPVVDAEGKLQGILSLNDVALAAKPDRGAKPGDITFEDLALVHKAVCEHRVATQELAVASGRALAPASK